MLKPSSASLTAGRTTSFQGSLPKRLWARAMPRTVPGTPTTRWREMAFALLEHVLGRLAGRRFAVVDEGRLALGEDGRA